MEGRESTARAREDQAGVTMKASDFETLHLMPLQGWLANRSGVQYRYTLTFQPTPNARHAAKSWSHARLLWDKRTSMPFTGTIEEARAAAAAFHQLMCIKHELEE